MGGTEGVKRAHDELQLDWYQPYFYIFSHRRQESIVMGGHKRCRKLS